MPNGSENTFCGIYTISGTLLFIQPGRIINFFFSFLHRQPLLQRFAHNLTRTYWIEAIAMNSYSKRCEPKKAWMWMCIAALVIGDVRSPKQYNMIKLIFFHPLFGILGILLVSYLAKLKKRSQPHRTSIRCKTLFTICQTSTFISVAHTHIVHISLHFTLISLAAHMCDSNRIHLCKCAKLATAK